MIVKTKPSELSKGARALYSISQERNGTIQGKDWETPRRIYGKKGAQDILPDPAFIQELVDAGLARTSSYKDMEHPYLWTDTIHAMYTNLDSGSTDNYGFYAEVRVHDPEASYHESNSPLLATLRGASILKSKQTLFGNQEIPQWEIHLRHDTITDREHDSIYLAKFVIANPEVSGISPTGMKIVGTLANAHFYEGMEYLDEPDECDGEGYCRRGKPHGVVEEFIPERSTEQIALRGVFVQVTLLDMRLVDENGNPLTPWNDED